MKSHPSGNAFYGWFDDATQTAPLCEPPRDAPCLYCGKPIHKDDVRSVSLMYAGQYAARSYFYRIHKSCDEQNKAQRGNLSRGVDDVILDMIVRNGD